MNSMWQLVMSEDSAEIYQLENKLGKTQAQAVDQLIAENWALFPAASEKSRAEDKLYALRVVLGSEIRRQAQR